MTRMSHDCCTTPACPAQPRVRKSHRVHHITYVGLCMKHTACIAAPPCMRTHRTQALKGLSSSAGRLGRAGGVRSFLLMMLMICRGCALAAPLPNACRTAGCVQRRLQLSLLRHAHCTAGRTICLHAVCMLTAPPRRRSRACACARTRVCVCVCVGGGALRYYCLLLNLPRVRFRSAAGAAGRQQRLSRASTPRHPKGRIHAEQHTGHTGVCRRRAGGPTRKKAGPPPLQCVHGRAASSAISAMERFSCRANACNWANAMQLRSPWQEEVTLLSHDPLGREHQLALNPKP